MTTYPPAQIVGGAWAALDGHNPEIQSAATAYGSPPNLIKSMINRESSGNWERDGSRLADVGRKKPDGSINHLLPFVGVFETTAAKWGFDFAAMVGNKQLQVDAMARGIALLARTYGGFESAATVYFGGPGALTKVFVDEFGMRSDVYAGKAIADWKALDKLSTGGPMPDLNLTKGLIPLPKITKRLITPAMKPAGVGWDDLGPRTVKGFVLHRMQGTLWGTDGHFRNPAVGALTDFGCDHQTGEVIQWNDPHGRMSGWASGRVSQPYGDGKAFIDKYGIVAVNRDQVSWELAGFFIAPGVTIESPWSDTSKQVTAQALAHYAHDYGIPWDVFPIAPQDGFSFVRWHQEFTIGTGKTCPGKTVMDATNALIERSRAIMKAAQLVTTEPPGPVPTPTPGIVYPGDLDKDLAAELFGTVTTADGRVYQFDEAGQVSRLWLEVGAAAEPDRFPRLRRVIDGKSGQRWFAFEGGTIFRQKGNLVEVVDATNAQVA